MNKIYQVAKKLGVELQFKNYERWENQPYVHIHGIDVFLIADFFEPHEAQGIRPFSDLPEKYQTPEHILQCAKDLNKDNQEYGTLCYCNQDYRGNYHYNYDSYDAYNA